MERVVRQTLLVYVCISMLSIGMSAQAQSDQHDSMQGMGDMPMDMSGPGWRFMQDGAATVIANHQSGPQGGDEVRLPNWWMGMATRATATGQLTVNSMFSLDPATVGRRGYRELFQAGEALDGKPLVDRQHPHDFFMQLSASWRFTLSDLTAVTIRGGPVDEPALGPTAYMHRPSAAALALTPLSHHTFDATHISFGVVSGAVERGRWTAEGSLFNGREPDDDRWDMDFGRLDSVSGRVTFRPTPEWAVQVSSGRLVDPEELRPGNVVRTTASAAWTEQSASNFDAWTVGFGMNAEHDATRRSAFAEWSRGRTSWTSSVRAELVQIEGDVFTVGSGAASASPLIGEVTVGAVRRVVQWRGAEGGLGANGTVYAAPAALQQSHGSHPASLQLFFRIGPRKSASSAAMKMTP